MNYEITGNFTSCETYFQTNYADLSVFFLNYFIKACLVDTQGIAGVGGSSGIDDFLTLIANKYFQESPQIVLCYDESWDISDMIRKLTITTNKAFVSYFLPLDEAIIGERIKTKPPDHITHKRLPKADAFIVFVKNEVGFENILRRISVYPWWNKRARVVVLVQENSLLPTKGILQLMEKEKLFNGVVVTSVVIQDNGTAPFEDLTSQQQQQQSYQQQRNDRAGQNENNQVDTSLSVALQVVALDPYPLKGHSKESYVGRWASGELQTIRPIFQEKIDNLRGNRLKVCVFEFPPLVIRKKLGKNNYTYTGLEVGLLSELANLLNFTYSFYEPPEGERWGSDLGNNTWTGLIGETQRTADFGFASVFLLDNRERAVDVSTPYDQDQGCFAVPRPEALQHWLGLVLPFSWQVWACIISMAIIAGPTFTVITRPLGMDTSLTVSRGIFYALGSLVSAQKPPQAKSHALRSFIISWLIFCWLAAILYRVALIVSLTIGPSAFKLDSMRQLAKSGLEWGGYPEVLKTFSNSTDSVDEKLFERFRITYNSSAALERVAKKGDFALLDSGKFLRYAEKGIYFDGRSSMIHVMKECPTRYNVGFVMPIGSPFLEKVNELIRRLQNAGIIEKWYNDILHQAAVKNPNRISGAGTSKKGRGLDIGDLKLCLVLLLCGYFCAFLSCLGENALQSYRSGNVTRVASSIIRKVSTVSGLSIPSLSSRGEIDENGKPVNPSIIITETEDTDQESTRSESLRSLPLDMEYGWATCERIMGAEQSNISNRPVSASLGKIKPNRLTNFKRLDEE